MADWCRDKDELAGQRRDLAYAKVRGCALDISQCVRIVPTKDLQ